MQVADNVFLLQATKGAYAYLVCGAETVLIDTGLPWQGKGIIRELAAMGVQPRDIKQILLTHYDVDHIGNAALLQEATGAKLWASETEIPYIRGDRPRPGFKKYLPYLLRVRRPEKLNAYVPGESIGGVKAEPTPGHTPGHVCLLYKDVLFAGDLVENKNGRLRPYPAAWNWNGPVLRESIKTVAALPFRLVCPAHGLPIERGGQWENLPR